MKDLIAKVSQRSLWLVFVLAIAPSLASALSTTERISDEQGYKNDWIWKFQIALGVIGVMYNGLSLALLLQLHNRNVMLFYSINVLINIINMIYSLEKAISPALSLSYSGYQSKLCQFEAVWESILGAWALQLIIAISLVVRHDICDGKKYSENEMSVLSFRGLVYSVGVTCFCLYIPFGGYSEDASGSYCFVKYSSYAGTPLYFFFALILPILFLVYNTHATFVGVKRAQEILRAHGINEQAKGPYIKMVSRLGYFAVSAVLTATPILIQSIYEWATGNYFDAIGSGIAGLILFSQACIVFPSLFFYLNITLREKLLEVVGYPILDLLLYLNIIKPYSREDIIASVKTVNRSNNYHSIRGAHSMRSGRSINSVRTSGRVYQLSNRIQNNSSRKPASNRIAPYANNGQFTPIDIAAEPENECLESALENGIQGTDHWTDYDDMNVWLTDAELFKVFLDHGRKEHATENFFFFKDVEKYQNKCIELHSKLSSWTINEKIDSNSIVPEEYQDDWKEIEALAGRIFSIFIKIPSAPLEINIPHATHTKIVNLICQGKEESKATVLFPRLTPEKAISMLEEYSTVFDASLNIVLHLLKSDAWRRFQQSIEYHAAIDNHMATHIIRLPAIKESDDKEDNDKSESRA